MRRLVALFLHLFPARFRRTFGDDMLAAFDDSWQERRGGLRGIRTLINLTAAALVERFSAGSAQVERREGDTAMTILFQDVRFALRTLIKSPGFTIVALATLALGIGVNTAMFSVANAVLWRSLPYSHPERLVSVGEVDSKKPDVFWGASYPNFRDWQARATSFENFAAVLSDDQTLREGSEPVRVSGLAVTHDFFDVLGVQAATGRVFTASDDRHDGTPVIVLSQAMWRDRFGADPSILGRSIHFDGSAFTVIGVMPGGFDYLQAEYWIPLMQVIPQYFESRRVVWVFTVVGRLREGKTVRDAQAEVEGIARQIRHDFPETDRGLVVRANLLRAQFSRDLRPALLVLLGAVGFVLLIACGNLAALMLVRGTQRVREMAIRNALGAGRRRIILQLLTETVMLSLAGGAVGVALAFRATRSIALLTKDPRLLNVPIDAPVLVFALVATLATAILSGLMPAFQASRGDTNEMLKGGSRSGVRYGRALAQRMLVAGEVALCLLLLTGAGLLFRSFRRVLEVDPGFRTEGLLTLRVNLPSGYKTVKAVTGLYRDINSRLEALPGVRGAAIVNRLPVSGGESTGELNIEGRPQAKAGGLGGATFRRVSPNYFQVMGIPLLRGRYFDDRDDATRGLNVIINQSMARRFWPNEDPIGRRIKVGPADSAPWETIVGVTGDAAQAGLDAEIGFATYEPLTQRPQLRFEIAVRAAGDLASLTPAVRQELHRIEPGLLVDHVETMAQRIDQSVAPRRLNLTLFALFAGLALVLASVGLYGVVAYAAGQRTQEFGIRMALGARPGDVARLVLGEGLKLALAGVGTGVVAALGLGRLLAGLLFGVAPTDFGTIATVALLLTSVALAACWLPAYRATRVEPTRALRCE